MNSIHKFLDKVNRANNSKSKQIVLTIEEATALTNDLSKILLDLTQTQKHVIDLQNTIDSNLNLNGGSFS